MALGERFLSSVQKFDSMVRHIWQRFSYPVNNRTIKR